jgi:ABC-type antimicrobial peptide transport system permease subunit
MSIVYPIKRVFRSWKLFAAFLIGIALAATFFACIDIKANIAAEQSLNQQLSSVNPDLEFTAWLNSTQLNQTVSNIVNINGVKNVDTIVRSNYAPMMDYDTNYTSYLQLISFPDSSPIYSDWIDRPAGGIGENQTYVISGTPMASMVKIGDNITAQMSFPTPNQGNWNTFWVNLTVAGFADLTDEGYSLASGNSFLTSPGTILSSQQIYETRSNALIVGWNSTFLNIWSAMGNRTVETTFMINVDRDKLISPWNVQASINNVNTVGNNIQENVLSKYHILGGLSNNIYYALEDFNDNFQSTLLEFVVLSIPIFIVAWYLGSTVSDVSFDMRRREIGLLSTKGLSSGQIQRMFLGEAITVGFIGGVAGVIGGLILNQVFIGKFNLNTLFNPQIFSPYTMVFTVVFGIAISLVAMFWSARKASRIPTVVALREYMDTSNQSYHKVLPWVATALGAYKIIVLLFAVNVPLALSNFSSGEFYLAILQKPLTYFDQIMTYIGPILFFWGVAKLLTQNSHLFEKLAIQFSRAMGEFGALAAKNVRRNPARVAAIFFLIAFIVAYGVQVTGQTASQQDYLVRQVKYSVGADISIGVSNSSDSPRILQDILANVTGIKSSTMVCTLQQPQTDTVVETIDPQSFLSTAYYESDWFSGASVQQMFHELETDNQTIILEQSIAQQENLKVGDTIALNFVSGARTLRIVGFFGPKLPANELSTSTITSSNGAFIPTEITIPYYYQLWSYVPRNLFNMTYGSGIYQAEGFDTNILLKLNPGVNGTVVANEIRNMKLDIDGVTSFDEQWRQSQNSQDQSTFYTLQVLDFQNLSVIFAVLSASVGMVLIAIVSLSERSREATLMSVRGVSYGQLVWMFLAENIAIITFAVLLGLAGGYVIDRGTILAANVGTLQLVYPHVIFPTSTLKTIAYYVGLIYASTILAILVMSRRYVTKLERMVRTR